MRFLDMSPYRPFRQMGRSCRTRPIREKEVRWVKPEPREHPEGVSGGPGPGDLTAAPGARPTRALRFPTTSCSIGKSTVLHGLVETREATP
jgi:hypothetical protein